MEGLDGGIYEFERLEQEEGVFHVLVDCFHERGRDGVGVIDEVLQNVDEHDGDDSEAPEGVDDMKPFASIGQ